MYWDGLATPPQCYTTLEPVTPCQNVLAPSTPPSPQVPPSRLWRRGPSRSGRVAYVLFGGQDDEPGIYHNWYVRFLSMFHLPLTLSLHRELLAAVLACYQNRQAPAYMGSDTEEEAITQYRHYEITGEIAFKVCIHHKIVLLNGLVVRVNPSPPRVVSCPQASPAPRVGVRRNPPCRYPHLTVAGLHRSLLPLLQPALL